MQTHLDQTLVEATARLNADWPGDVAAYDAVVAHILVMADVLSDGIAAQFPEKVSAATTMTSSDGDLHRAMRGLWEDHVTWTRVFLIDAIAGLPDTPQATQRLLQNQVDIGNAIKPFYGSAAGDQLATLLHDHITGAAALVTAAMGRDTAKIAAAKTAWYANADQIAVFLAAANPNWALDDLKTNMRMHLDETLAEATARLTADWAGDVAAYDAVVAHILAMADVLSDGIAKQMPGKLE
jgi:crotonobetainyl-CoA:carnitine CoA-transferase CaiB-like acyl-CoA transferase